MKYLILCVYILLLSNPALSYKQALHVKMSHYAAKQSLLSGSGYWNDWGINSTTKFSFQKTNVNVHPDNISAYNYWELMGYGSDAEDTGEGVSVSRSFSHFFNPQNNKKLTLTPIVDNFTSADWMLEGTNLGLSGEISFQKFSYSDAQYYFYLAFTSGSENERNINMGKMFQTLGHLVHHIQDMAQPEHTRTDAHCDHPACVAVSGALGVDDTSLYEEFTAQMLKCGAFSEAPVSAGDYIRCGNILSFGDVFYVKKTYIGGYPAPKFPDPRAYWTSSDKKGLADFSSSNFITTDTPYQITSGAPNIPLVNRLRSASDDLPMPDGNTTQTYTTVVDAQNIIPPIKTAIIEKYKNYKMQFVGLRTLDYVTGKEVDISQMASFSIFTERYMTSLDPMQTRPMAPKAIFSVNHANLRQRAEILLPRAVGYSTGFINHFFRHRLQVTATSEGVFRVRNATNEYFNGQIHFYYDDNNGQRIHIPSATQSVSLLSGSSIVFDAKSLGSLSNRSSKFYAVAVQKTNLASKPFAAVAAVAFEYPKPNPNCDAYNIPINQTGSLVTDINLGNTAGYVYIGVARYDQVLNSSSAVITKVNGEPISCSWSPFADITTNGFGILFKYDPDLFPEYKIRVTTNRNVAPSDRPMRIFGECPSEKNYPTVTWYGMYPCSSDSVTRASWWQF